MELIYTDSSLKNGITTDTIEHIIRTGDFLGSDHKGGIWWLGPDPDGEGVEVIAHTLYPHTITVYHAMLMRWRRQ